MRIIFAEIKKLFSHRLFPVCLVAFFAVNCFVLYFTCSRGIGLLYSQGKDKYDSLLAEFLQYDNDTALAQAKKLNDAYSLAMNLATIGSGVGEDAGDNSSAIQEYKESMPQEYALAVELIEQGIDYDMQIFVQDIYKKYEYFEDYKTFVGEMRERADYQLSFAIFSQPGTFSYNNIDKTPADFEALKDIKLTAGSDYAVTSSTTFVLTDYLVAALAVLICLALVVVEREKKLLGLVKSAKNGRTATMASKLAVILGAVTAVALLFYGANFAFCQSYFGFGDLNRPIQSIEMFMNCSYKLTVLQYLLLYIGGKLMVLWTLALVLTTIFVLVKNSGGLYLITAAFLAAEFSMYTLIRENAMLDQLKYVNIFYCLFDNNFIGEYRNVNIFSLPVNVPIVFTVLFIAVTAISIPLCCYAFSVQSQFSSKGIISARIKERLSSGGKIHGSPSVFKGECYKHYISSKVILAVAVLLLFAYGEYTQNISVNYNSTEDAYYGNYLLRLSGELTPEKEQFMIDESEYFNNYYEQRDKITQDDSLSQIEKENQLSALGFMINDKEKAFQRVEQQYMQMLQTAELHDLEPYFLDALIVRKISSSGDREWHYFVILLMSVVFCLSSVFACERKRNVISLLRCTKNGKLKLFLIKLLISFITCIVCFTAVYLPYFINFINTYGTEILSYPLIFDINYGAMSSSAAILQTTFLTAAVHAAVAFLLASFVLLLSDRIKSSIMTITVATAASLIPCLVVMQNSSARLYAFVMNGSFKYLFPSIIAFCAVAGVIMLIAAYMGFAGVNPLKKKRN